MTINLKTIIVIAAVIVVAYFVYANFFAEIKTDDIGELMEMHRAASPLRQRTIVKHVVKLYKRDEHYEMMLAALDDNDAETQALAVEVFTMKRERRAIPKLFKMLKDPSRASEVTERVVKAFGVMRTTKEADRIKIVDRFIELTDDGQPHRVRVAAHELLKDMLETGIVKFGDGMRSRWAEVWKDRKAALRGA